MKLSKILYLGFGVLLILIITVLVVSYTHSNKLIDSTDWITHTEEVLGKLEEVKSHLIDAETGQRGYLITGKKRYLEPYDASIEHMHIVIGELRALTSDNPVQQENLDKLEPLVAKKLDELKETIVLRREVGLDAAKKVVLSDKGKKIMDDIRILIDEMGAEEMILLEERSQVPIEARQTTNILLTVLLVVSLLIGGGIAFFIARLISKPIKELTQTVDEVTKGKLDVQLSKSNIFEIQNLTNSLNRILASMKLAILRTGVRKEKIVGLKKQTPKNSFRS